MKSWKARLVALLAAVALLVVVQGPVMADDFDDCEFRDHRNVIVCHVDDDDEFLFFDDDFDGIDDRFGAEIDGECFGIS